MTIGILPSTGSLPRVIAVRTSVPQPAEISAGGGALAGSNGLAGVSESPDQRQAAVPFNRPTSTGRPISIGGAAVVDAQVQSQEAASRSNADNPLELSEEEKAVVEELKARDREVRAHEAAHAATGAPYASSPTYEFQRGPDGRQYAVGGQVSIDTSPIPGDPEATIKKMETVRRAALAPAKPSGQDLAVARNAAAAAQTASADVAKERAEEAAALLAGSDESPVFGFAQPQAPITDIIA